MDALTFLINATSPDPIYRQIAEQVRRFVAAGQLQAGEGLPSVRDMAEQHAINPMTVSRAYSQLEGEGVLERRRGIGMVVAGNRAISLAPDERLRLLEPRLREVVREATDLGLSADPVCERLQEVFDASVSPNPGSTAKGSP